MRESASRGNSALVAIHYQNDVIHADGRVRAGSPGSEMARHRLVSVAKEMLRGARALRLPIFHVRIAFRPDYSDLIQNCVLFQKVAEAGAVKDGDWGAQFFEGLGPEGGQTEEFVINHLRTSAFIGTELNLLLSRLNVRHLIIAGVATHSAVEMTVRHATDLGYWVTVAADACGCADAQAHEASLSSMALVSEVTSVRLALEQVRG